jgi:hypothetical protein
MGAMDKNRHQQRMMADVLIRTIYTKPRADRKLYERIQG